MDQCIVCNKDIPDHLTVCSRKCSGKLGGSAKTTKPKGYAARPDLASEHGKKGKPYTKKERPVNGVL